jgi:kinesin family protein C2/C3
VLFVNAGGCAIEGADPSSKVSDDSCFEGGDAIETSEVIVEGGDYPSLYSSARYGNFSYRFDGLAPGDYYLDLHFAEIVHTDGPKGIRSFDVLVQEDKANSLTCCLVVSLHVFLPYSAQTICLLVHRSCLNLMCSRWSEATGPFKC